MKIVDEMGEELSPYLLKGAGPFFNYTLSNDG